MKVDVWIPITNGAEEGDRFVVRGISISEEPNNLDMVMDYDTSKPYMIESAKAFEARTNGESKGSLRIMHTAQVAGKVIEMDFDDVAKTIPVAAEVIDEAAQKMVEERAYTGFSWGGRTVGKPWLDKDLTAKHGRPIHRYTFRPVELSLVDAPRVPGTHFTSVENADIEEEEMEDAPAPVDPAPIGEKVENGVYTAGRLMECLESLSYLQKVIEAEESKEGDSAEIPAELKAGLQAIAPAIAKYAAAQVDELAGGHNEDLLIDELEEIEGAFDDDMENGDIENGDYPGHPFRGNQHKKAGKRGGSAKARAGHKASKAAAVASAYAKKGKGAGHHDTAATNHRAAAAHHAKAGNKKLSDYHTQKAGSHESTAAAIRSRTNNGDEPEVKNGDVDQLSALMARVEALEAKASVPVENGDKPELPAAPMPVLVTITKDEESQVIANGDSPAKMAAVKIAALPEHERSKAFIQYQLSGQI